MITEMAPINGYHVMGQVTTLALFYGVARYQNLKVPMRSMGSIAFAGLIQGGFLRERTARGEQLLKAAFCLGCIAYGMKGIDVSRMKKGWISGALFGSDPDKPDHVPEWRFQNWAPILDVPWAEELDDAILQASNWMMDA